MTPDIQPIFAFEAYAFSLKMLENAAYLDTIKDYPGIHGYQFWKDGQNLWVIWGIQEQAQTIDLPAVPQAIYDVYGNPLPASETIDISKDVLYLEFES